MSSGTPDEKLKQIFRIFDSDGNGTISEDEMKSVVNHLYHLIPEKDKSDVNSIEEFSKSMMEEMDKNKDGEISEEEFMLAFTSKKHLTTILVNKLMQRAVSAQFNILQD